MAERTAPPARWSDLTTRILSALVMLALAGGALFGGVALWSLFVLAVYALMLRELAGLCDPALPGIRRWMLALLPVTVAAVLLVVLGAARADAPELLPAGLRTRDLFIVALLPLAMGVFFLGRGRALWLAYGLLLAGAAITLVTLRAGNGPLPILLLVGIVMISDIAGYFAGRALGGPKFWPRISPKKTWSGTIAGWIGAAIFGAVAGAAVLGIGPWMGVPLAVVLAFAGQMGDIIESWMKRRVGVKDASALIPGHGGVLDRLDALVAVAALAGGVLWLIPQLSA